LNFNKFYKLQARDEEESKMIQDQIIEAAMKELAQKLRQAMNDLPMDTLTADLAEKVGKGLQQSIRSAALVAYQTFIESYDVHTETIEVEGKILRLKIPSEKTFLTPFGELTMRRNLYQADRGGSAYIPLDEQWGMAGEYATPEVQECILFGMAHLTAKEVESFLKKSSLFHPSEKAIKNIVEKTGEVIETHVEALNAAIRAEEEVPAKTTAVVASMDGANVLLRENGQQRGRPQERPGEENSPVTDSAYKNAMVGSISFYKPEVNDDGQLEPMRLRTLYLARMPEAQFPTFKRQFEQELDHVEKALGEKVTKILLNDGHRTIWNYVDHHERFAEYEKLVDFYHTSEHLSHAAEALFGKKSKAADEWYDKWYDKLLEEDNAANAILRSMDYYAQHLKIPKSRLKDLEKEQIFFQRNQHRMNYADFIRRGLPIGSGPVEAACKSVVKTRLCRSGMRWSRKGGQKILNLRVYVKADRWDSFWKNYKQLKCAA
jgi:hypothetical protein